ncbi:NADH-quinone oxidoreductase subunit C [Termitidicoccus mucosus]|uniref:NADH-quinone oxidoreductase subunit C n=1 Tax=Termitidicoccus mucosus TaxID=1184151 RepID=UPI003183B1AB
MALKTTAPVVLRLRTANRADDVTVPSLTPVWRSCEFQEREVFDLFGVRFEGHPISAASSGRIQDHPMRKDYVSPTTTIAHRTTKCWRARKRTIAPPALTPSPAVTTKQEAAK